MHDSIHSHFLFLWHCPLPHLHSFPTRRSSDLPPARSPPSAAPPDPYRRPPALRRRESSGRRPARDGAAGRRPRGASDRKSTRLNSSHLVISYAVFCLKKKKNTEQNKRK